MPEKVAPKRPKDERRQLIIRGLIAVAVIAVMLIVLSSWERLRRDDTPAPPPATRLATPEAMQSAAAGAAQPAQSEPAAPAQSEAIVEESAAEETTGMPLGAATAPEAPATETTPQVDAKPADKVGKRAAAVEPAPRETPAAPAHAAADAAHDKPRAADKDAAQTAPRLVVQAEPAPPGPTAPPGRAFAVQVGIFSNPANAEELQSRLRAAGIPAQIETRVAVGPFKSRDEALRAQEKIRELGLGKGQLVIVK
ncbi:SPOR domain-containing protein [Niveibacterium sp. SC-1]|uniref:SPOR domain-containing protein n=1 Tax=Niveibacterium sp. SC-1 TaxID=3135646 RepID=UPI00311E463F